MLAKYHNFGIRNVKGFRMSIYLEHESEYQRRTLYGRHAHPHAHPKSKLFCKISFSKSVNRDNNFLRQKCINKRTQRILCQNGIFVYIYNVYMLLPKI